MASGLTASHRRRRHRNADISASGRPARPARPARRALTDLELPLPPLLDLFPKLLFHRLVLLQQAHEPALGRLDLLFLRLVLGELVERLNLVLVGRGELTGGSDQTVRLASGGAVRGRVQAGLPGWGWGGGVRIVITSTTTTTLGGRQETHQTSHMSLPDLLDRILHLIQTRVRRRQLSQGHTVDKKISLSDAFLPPGRPRPNRFK